MWVIQFCLIIQIHNSSPRQWWVGVWEVFENWVTSSCIKNTTFLAGKIKFASNSNEYSCGPANISDIMPNFTFYICHSKTSIYQHIITLSPFIYAIYLQWHWFWILHDIQILYDLAFFTCFNFIWASSSI